MRHTLQFGPHLGPILLQFPASFPRDERRLDDFLRTAATAGADQVKPRLVFELRHESWFTDEVYRLLKRRAAALCIADSPTYPRESPQGHLPSIHPLGDRGATPDGLNHGGG